MLPGKEGPACSLTASRAQELPALRFPSKEQGITSKIKPAVLLSKLTRYFALKYSFLPLHQRAVNFSLVGKKNLKKK